MIERPEVITETYHKVCTHQRARPCTSPLHKTSLAMKREALPNTTEIQQVVKLRKGATEAPFA